MKQNVEYTNFWLYKRNWRNKISNKISKIDNDRINFDGERIHIMIVISISDKEIDNLFCCYCLLNINNPYLTYIRILYEIFLIVHY